MWKCQLRVFVLQQWAVCPISSNHLVYPVVVHKVVVVHEVTTCKAWLKVNVSHMILWCCILQSLPSLPTCCLSSMTWLELTLWYGFAHFTAHIRHLIGRRLNKGKVNVQYSTINYAPLSPLACVCIHNRYRYWFGVTKPVFMWSFVSLWVGTYTKLMLKCLMFYIDNSII